MVEDGAASDSKGTIAAHGETPRVDRVVLDVQVVLELVVGDDRTGALALVCEDAAFERAVGLGGAGDGGCLGGEFGGQWHGVVFEVARVI